MVKSISIEQLINERNVAEWFEENQANPRDCIPYDICRRLSMSYKCKPEANPRRSHAQKTDGMDFRTAYQSLEC